MGVIIKRPFLTVGIDYFIGADHGIHPHIPLIDGQPRRNLTAEANPDSLGLGAGQKTVKKAGRPGPDAVLFW